MILQGQLYNNTTPAGIVCGAGPITFMKDLIETHEVMRLAVEEILIKGAEVFNLPTCPSQSLRALRMVDAINAMPFGDARGGWLVARHALEDFIILNNAIRILERL